MFKASLVHCEFLDSQDTYTLKKNTKQKRREGEGGEGEGGKEGRKEGRKKKESKQASKLFKYCKTSHHSQLARRGIFRNTYGKVLKNQGSIPPKSH